MVQPTLVPQYHDHTYAYAPRLPTSFHMRVILRRKKYADQLPSSLRGIPSTYDGTLRYKNQLNDLQLMSDAPVYHLFVLLPQ